MEGQRKVMGACAPLALLSYTPDIMDPYSSFSLTKA